MVLMMFSLFFLTGGIAAAQWFEEQLPPLLPPPQYGNILINRNSVKSDMLPVSFSHWIHRSKYTCRVCHTELEIDMKVNSTEITMDKIGKGQYCGACHDGETAFGQEECQKCHTGDIAAGSDKFKKLPSLPKTGFGNRIDWVEAWKKKLIKPKKALRPGEYSPPTFKKFLTLQAEWNNIPPSIFPHDIHNSWLDCSSCHPDVFNIKLKTTKHFLMTKMFEGKFCGACHLNVAFPLNDCKRCHPAINR
ncbi:MAG: hypothetical protein HZA17_03960 [Nitrospirae bacterium]|nr:hypothetical protein [Nitrospirota bacterium]